MEKALWGKRVEHKIHVSEAKLDETVQAVFDLVSEIHAAAADMNVSAVSTNPSLTKLMETAALLQDARTALIAGHHRIEKLGKGLDIRPVGFGPTKVESDDVVAEAPAADRLAV